MRTRRLLSGLLLGSLNSSIDGRRDQVLLRIAAIFFFN